MDVQKCQCRVTFLDWTGHDSLNWR
jgi:hypothetical protein